jgi:hypothetical protein
MSLATRELREVLADLVVNMVVFAELSGEHEMHPDTAVKWLEGIVAELQSLGATDRLWLYEHVKGAAADEPHPDHRHVLEWLAGELLEEAE